MKFNSFLTLLLTFFIFNTALAQVPQAINYQAVIRTDSGLVVPNKSVNVRLSVQDGLTTPPQYVELHAVTTNQFGLVTLSIGKGAASTGVFAQINWGVGEKYLKTEVDLNRTGTYTVIGVQQFLSVPYALYAEKSGSGSAASDAWKVTGNAATTGQFLGTTNLQDVKVFTNNLQRATFAADGNVGIGINTPPAKLSIEGTGDGTGIADDRTIVSINNKSTSFASQANLKITAGNSTKQTILTHISPTYTVYNGYADYGELTSSGNGLILQAPVGQVKIQTGLYAGGVKDRVTVTNAGNVGIGTNTPSHRLRVETNSDETGSNDRVQMQLHNNSNNSEALAGLGISSGNTGTNTWLEHVGANYNVYSGGYTDFNDLGYLASTGRNGLMMMSYPNDSKMRFAVGTSSNIPVTRMSLSVIGLGLGTQNPTAQLHNVGTARFEGLAANNAGNQVLVADPSGNIGLRDVSTLPSGGGGTGWLLTGNSTNSSNYIGTNNANDLRIFTSGSQKMVVKTTGNVGIGTNTPPAKLSIEGTGDGTGALDDRTIVSINNNSTSYASQANLKITAGNTTSQTILTHISPTYTVYNGYADYGELTSSGKGLILQAPVGEVKIQTGLYSGGVRDRVTVTNEGNVGIGTNVPTSKLTIEATGDGLGAVEDRVLLKVDNKSTSNASTTNVLITGGNSAGFTMLSHVSPTYTVANQADYGQLWNTGNGIIIRASPSTANPNHPGNIRFFTGFSPDVYNNLYSNERMRIEANGNVGIGTRTPKAKIEVAEGDVYVSDATKGIILKSPNGNCWRVTVDNIGNFVRTAIICPQ